MVAPCFSISLAYGLSLVVREFLEKSADAAADGQRRPRHPFSQSCTMYHSLRAAGVAQAVVPPNKAEG